MRAMNHQYTQYWQPAQRNIIYLEEHRKPAVPQRQNTNSVIWNSIFMTLCIAVLAVLFLH